MTESENTIGCNDGCGKRVLPEDVDKGGWFYLESTGRIRCAECYRALQIANGYAQPIETPEPHWTDRDK